MPLPRLAQRLAALFWLIPAPSHAQDAPPAWQGLWAYLVQTVCADAADHPRPGISPLESCPHPRKLTIGEPLPYHKRDWPGLPDRARQPDGYLQSDSYPIRTILGPAVVQTGDFGDAIRRFGQFDAGDGGQVIFFTADTAAIGITEDGGAGLQFFLGPNCRPLDSWVITDSNFATQPSGDMLARITRRRDTCPQRLGYAYTRWHVEPVRYRYSLHGQPGRTTLPTLISDHFGGRSVAAAEHLERMYFTQPLGYTRWERWQNLAVRGGTAEREQAALFAASGRCEPGIGPPAPGEAWVLIDCREWTQIVPAADPAGDKPSFWLDRLQADPATRSLFAP